MSALVFPVLPGWDVKKNADPSYATRVYTSVSGQEQRVSWYPAPRIKYTVMCNTLSTTRAAPAPFGTYSEIGVLRYFHDVHRGSWDSFVFVDPYDGVSRQVRFESDELKTVQVVPGIWSAQFGLISVV